MLPNLLSELRTKRKNNFSGLIYCIDENNGSTLGKIYFLTGSPIHFASEDFGEGFSGLLDLYIHQRHIVECRYEDDLNLYIIDRPTISYHFDRLVINLLESYQEKKALHKILNLGSESIISW